jgi:diaminohydroxyphosphoribosylaminopyrimidine deaminase/5-amino-6-(5-phosphoribosylamino)uracil reductase
MDRALFHAARGRGRTSPNPVVGAIVVSRDDVVVGYGHHERAGAPHAEIRALEMAGDRARGATLYCSLEPCPPFGPGVTRRTGPCVVRIVEAAVARVVASVEDPNPLVSGLGFSYLKSRGVEVEVGLRAEKAAALNQPYFALMRTGRPFVILKAAVSLDGYIAEARGLRTHLTSAAADRHAHQLRAEVDAIAVGVGTILVDDPLLTPRGVYRERPLTRVIFDRALRTPPAARLLSTREAGPVIIVTTPRGLARPEARDALEARGAHIEVAADGTLRAALERLGARHIESLVLEGGAELHRAAWSEEIADFVQLYITPHVIGPGGVPFLDARTFSTAALVNRRIEPIGPDVLVEGYVHRPH